MAKKCKVLKIPAILFITLLVVPLLYSQSITWQRTYQSQNIVANEYGYGSCRADGDNIYILGTISNTRILLLKINPYGDTIWTKKIGTDFTWGRAIIEADSGSCIITGDYQNYETFAVKVNKNGEIAWLRFYGGQYAQLYEIKNTTDSNYILCGTNDYSSAVILKIDKNGNLIWKKLFTAGFRINILSIENHTDNGFIFTGFRSETANQLSKGLIFVVDSLGNLTWDTTFTFNRGSIGGEKIIKSNNGYIISAQTGTPYLKDIVFIKTNNDGNIIYSKLLDTTYAQFDIGDLKMIQGNRYLMTMSRLEGNLTNGKIAILDSMGVETKTKIFTSLKQIMFGSCTVLSDTGYIFCGFLDNHGNTGRDLYVIKCDTGLNTPPFIGITTLSHNVPSAFKLYQNYPNPFNPFTNIKFEIPVAGKGYTSDVIIKIFDILGREVYSVNYNKPPGIYEFKFDGYMFTSGIYFYKISAGEYTDTKKMILIK